MKNNISTLLAISGILFSSLFACSVAADDTEITELKERMLSLEKKLDQVLNKLGASGEPQKRSKPAGSAQQQVLGMKAGPILDIWLLDGKEMKRAPTKPSLGAMVDESSLFNFSSFTNDADLKVYYKKDPTGLMWSGYLNIEEGGDYLIVHELDVKPTPKGRGWVYSIYSKLLVNDDVILTNEKYGLRGAGGLFPESTSIKLKPGAYKLQLWLAVKWDKRGGYSGNYNLDPSTINVNIKLRSPSSRKPVAITKESLFHKES